MKVPYHSDLMRSYLESFYGPTPLEPIMEAAAGVDYVLLECPDCALIFQEYVPGDQLLGELYEKWLDPVTSELHSREKALEPRLALQVLEIIDHVDRPPNEIRILDFGMGWGEFCRIATALGCDVAGAELSATRRDRATEYGIPIVDVEDDRVPPFDFINTEQVFEHLTRPAEVLGHLQGRLTDTGVVRLSVPNCVDIRRRLRIGDWMAPKGSKHSLNAVAPLEHVNCYQHSSLVALAARFGLRPVYRPWRQLRFSPTWESPGVAARFTFGRLYRSLRQQDTQVWLSLN